MGGVMTPPSSAGPTEAINQEMETIPSQGAEQLSVLYTADMCEVDIRRLSSATRSPTPNGHYEV